MEITQFIIFFALLIPSAIIHEYAHGWMADKLGDPTARFAGRLTLNPMAHVDPMGTFILPIVLGVLSAGSFMFAYAKPVPFNPYNLKYPKWGPAMVGAAGPASNLLIAVVFGLLIAFVPVAPAVVAVMEMVVFVNILLVVFNMVPIPPLDGSKVLFAMLPRSMNGVVQFLERHGILLLFAFIFFAFSILEPIIFWLFRLIV